LKVAFRRRRVQLGIEARFSGDCSLLTSPHLVGSRARGFDFVFNLLVVVIVFEHLRRHEGFCYPRLSGALRQSSVSHRQH
jgi:hypothetical protein